MLQRQTHNQRAPLSSGSSGIGVMRPSSIPDRKGAVSDDQIMAQRERRQMGNNPQMMAAHRSMQATTTTSMDIDETQPAAPPEPPASPPQTTHVVYTLASCPNSIKILQALAQNHVPSILVQDVRKLNQKPAWLNGVPLVADTQFGLLYRGSDAMLIIDKLIQKSKSNPTTADHPPAAAAAAPVQKAPAPPPKKQKNPMDALFSEDSTAGPSDSARAIQLPDNSARYTESSAKLSDSRIEEMKAMRGKVYDVQVKK